MPRSRDVTCRYCGHHKSLHQYTPGQVGPRTCRGKGCQCPAYVGRERRMLTKAEALSLFRERFPGETFMMERNGKRWMDSVARAEAWNDFTDGLCDEQRISMKQCSNWSNPF